MLVQFEEADGNDAIFVNGDHVWVLRTGGSEGETFIVSTMSGLNPGPFGVVVKGTLKEVAGKLNARPKS